MENTHGAGTNANSQSRTIIICTEDDFPKEERPPCPECGCVPKSHGICWECTKCGRWYKKLYRPRIIDYKKRPLCPTCGGGHVWSHNKLWQCSECGRSFIKHPIRPCDYGKGGLYCPTCGGKAHIHTRTKSTTRWRCSNCRKGFNIRNNTRAKTELVL